MGNSEVFFNTHSSQSIMTISDCPWLSFQDLFHIPSLFAFPKWTLSPFLYSWGVKQQVVTQWLSNTIALQSPIATVRTEQQKEKLVHPSAFAIHQKLRHTHLSFILYDPPGLYSCLGHFLHFSREDPDPSKNNLWGSRMARLSLH